MKAKQTLRKLLNYSFLNYTNKTQSCGSKDLPALYCKTEVYPDFLALYSEPKLIEQVFVFISLIMYLMVREGCLKQYTMMIRQDLITSRNALKV